MSPFFTFFSSPLAHRRMKAMEWFWIVLFLAGWLLISRFTGG
jgi:drug/metabolite transporter (DMT)-like permease